VSSSKWPLVKRTFDKMEFKILKEAKSSLRRIGVVGGSGYIGSAIADHLSNIYEVRIIDAAPLPLKLEGRVSYSKCDITQYEEVQKALYDLDLIIHTAIIQIPLINENKRLGYKVNVLGTKNICECVDKSPSIKGLLLSGTWHVFGERELSGTIDESYGFRPDKVEDRARLYAMSKIAQEVIVRFYDEMSEKIFGVIRLGTVLGEGMPEKTAANIFISNGVGGKPLTPFKNSMYRPMLYVDVKDVSACFLAYSEKILSGEITNDTNSLNHVVNLYWPEPITILELAEIIGKIIERASQGKVKPTINLVDNGQPPLFEPEAKLRINANIEKLSQLLNFKGLTEPYKSMERLISKAFDKQH
jgi:nucleoside-diphosphate-sugar epimerase